MLGRTPSGRTLRAQLVPDPRRGAGRCRQLADHHPRDRDRRRRGGRRAAAGDRGRRAADRQPARRLTVMTAGGFGRGLVTRGAARSSRRCSRCCCSRSWSASAWRGSPTRRPGRSRSPPPRTALPTPPQTARPPASPAPSRCSLRAAARAAASPPRSSEGATTVTVTVCGAGAPQLVPALDRAADDPHERHPSARAVPTDEQAAGQ